jgi:hypothetical protein
MAERYYCFIKSSSDHSPEVAEAYPGAEWSVVHPENFEEFLAGSTASPVF